MVISIIFMTLILLLSGSLIGYTTFHVSGERQGRAREQALNLAEAGIERSLYQLNYGVGSGYTGEVNFNFGGGVTDITVATISGSRKRATATSYVPDKANPRARRVVETEFNVTSTVIAFNYGVQVGAGGLEMDNNARVNGSVYSNGIIDGANGARITGDAYSAGATGRIFDRLQIDGNGHAHTINLNVGIGGSAYGYNLDQVTVGGNALAYSISNCTIGGNASYTTKTSCTIGGTQTTPYSGEPDPPILDFPISDSQINDWKTQAAGGGTISGNYTLTNGATGSLGPRKITGNLTLSNNAILTLTGPLWVVGTVSVSNNAIIRLDPGYGDTSEVIISDNSVDVSNNAIFQKAGLNSYILMITTKTGSDAFEVSNNADSLIVYAPNGGVEISNNAILREVTAYELELENNSQVTYETGLADVEFSGGPGGAWGFIRGTRVEKK